MTSDTTGSTAGGGAKTREELVRTLSELRNVMAGNLALAHAGSREHAQAWLVLEAVAFTLMWCAGIRPRELAAGLDIVTQLTPDAEGDALNTVNKCTNLMELLDKCAGDS